MKHFYDIVVPVAAAGLTFLSLNKKVSKELSLGEALTSGKLVT